jgi:hypothetical protein
VRGWTDLDRRHVEAPVGEQLERMLCRTVCKRTAAPSRAQGIVAPARDMHPVPPGGAIVDDPSRYPPFADAGGMFLTPAAKNAYMRKTAFSSRSIYVKIGIVFM